MAKAFIITYTAAIAIGVVLGLLTYFVFEHDNKQEWCDWSIN